MSSSLITRPLSLGESLDVAFRLYRKHFWKLVLTVGGLILPVQFLAQLFSLWSSLRYPLFDGFQTGAGFGNAPAWITIVQVLLGIIALILSLFASVAVLWQANRILMGESPGVLESWRGGLRYIWRYIGLSFLLGIVVFVVMFVLAFSFIIPCLGILMAIAILIFGFYLFIRLILAPMALVADDLGPIDAIKKAWDMSRDRFWRIFFYGFLLWLLVFVLYFLPMSFVQAQALRAGITAETLKNFTIISFVVGIISNILSVLWTPLYTLALMVLYHETRIRQKPDLLIEDQIAALEAEADVFAEVQSDVDASIAETSLSAEVEDAREEAATQLDEIVDSMEEIADDSLSIENED